MNAKFVFALVLGFSFGANASENTILLADGKAKSGKNSLTVDLALSEDVSAFSFLVALPKGAKSIDTSKCLAALPSTHTGKCGVTAAGDKVAIVAYSAMNTPLPLGITNLGEIQYLAANIRGGSKAVALEKVKLASPHKSGGVQFAVEAVNLNKK